MSIDWQLAATVGKKVARPGPVTTGYTMTAAREELAASAVAAEAPVREITGLADGLPVPTAQILDRDGWIEAATLSMSSMLDPSEPDEKPGISGRIAGVQAGGLLALLSGAILGQYDPFTPDPSTGTDGVLMLVTPNIIAVERALRVVPSDFRLWVCLHEVTHRVQFSANPWLSDYMSSNVEALTSDTGESSSEMVARISSALRDRRGSASESGESSGQQREKGIVGAMQLLQSPEQYEAFSRMMMLGTLLEGHADHVMDAVGPAKVPTVDRIRASFDKRRARPQNPVQRLLRALLGMDAKLAQYVRGKAFVDEVVGAVGMTRFNAIWTGPETMPLPAEIEQPRLWIDRVL